jgi:hypothetical protein
VSPSRFVFFLCVLFLFAISSIYGPLLLNAFYYFCLKRANNKKGVNKTNGIEKLFLLHLKFKILRNYSLASESGISYIFGFVQYLPTPELETFVGTVH